MSFLAGAFLAGLAALTVPLWLHRMNDRAAAETTVSSLMLMREAETPTRSRRALAHRLLLALRLAFLALIALAFAQPALEIAAGSGTDRAAAAKLVVLDGSLSMRRTGVWAEALATAGRLLDSDASRLVLAGSRLALVSELEAAAPGWTRLDFAGLSNRLDALLATLPEPPGGWHIHLVSDFQASAVPERFNALVDGALWPLTLHRVGAAEDNWAVESAIVAGDRVEVAVASYAAQGRNLAVALGRAGDDEAERQRLDVSVPAGARRTVAFSIPAAGRQRVAWEVALDAGDAVPEDDVAWAIQAAVDAAAVVLIAPDADADALRFLAAALEASGAADPTRVEDAAWPRSASAAIVLDPGPLPTALQRRLERYLANGGGALLVAGERSQRHGVLPVAGILTGSVVAGARRVVGVAGGHPAGKGSWEDVTIRRTVALASPGETILALADAEAGAQADAPLLVEKRFGKGRVLVLLTALDREWGSLVLQPAFVGLIGNAVDYLAHNATPSAKAGEAVAIAAASVQIFDALGRRVLTLDETAQRPLVRIDSPGVYTVRTPGRESSMAVHVDARESNLQPASVDFLARWQALGADARGKAAAVDQALPAAADAATSLLPLAPWLLALAAALLLAESVAANLGRFDFRRLPVRAPGRGRE